VTAAKRVSAISPRQAAADRANLVKARAALKGRARTAKQKAASRRNLAIARSAQRARASGKAPAARKKPAAPLPSWLKVQRELILPRIGPSPGALWLDLQLLPVCGPVALAEHLLIHTGACVTPADIIALWQKAGNVTLGELLDAAREHGLGGEKLAYFEQCDPEAGSPGLIYGVRLGSGYHAALATGDGMISWCRALPRDGTPEEAWWLEWEGE
jgi:hypothetical protein